MLILQSPEWLKLLTQINFLRNRNVVFICNHVNENNSKCNEMFGLVKVKKVFFFKKWLDLYGIIADGIFSD